MNHNMQLNINHRISFGASYTGAYHPAQITVPEKKKTTKKKNPQSSATEWILFFSSNSFIWLPAPVMNDHRVWYQKQMEETYNTLEFWKMGGIWKKTQHIWPPEALNIILCISIFTFCK